MKKVCLEAKRVFKCKEEGVEFEFFASPKLVLNDDSGKVVGIQMVKNRSWGRG